VRSAAGPGEHQHHQSFAAFALSLQLKRERIQATGMHFWCRPNQVEQKTPGISHILMLVAFLIHRSAISKRGQDSPHNASVMERRALPRVVSNPSTNFVENLSREYSSGD